jgi:hypothetical protein
MTGARGFFVGAAVGNLVYLLGSWKHLHQRSQSPADSDR